MAKPLNSGKPQTRQIAISARTPSVRPSGTGRRSAVNAASAIRPAPAARPAARKPKPSSGVASRVAGRVPPKITTPTRPSSSPSFVRSIARVLLYLQGPE